MRDFQSDMALVYFNKALDDLTAEEFEVVTERAYQEAESWEDGQ